MDLSSRNVEKQFFQANADKNRITSNPHIVGYFQTLLLTISFITEMYTTNLKNSSVEYMRNTLILKGLYNLYISVSIASM